MMTLPSDFVHRYSVRTAIGFGIIWGIMVAGQAFAVFITTSQFLHTSDTSIILPGMFAVFLVLFVSIAVVWLRNRPTLEMSPDGIFVSRIGSRRFLLRWSDIRSVEDFRRFNVQTGRPLRSFQLVWSGGRVKFDQYYTGLRDLLVRLNTEIKTRGIKVNVHNYEPLALQKAIEESRRPDDKKRLRRQGVVFNTVGLELT